MKKKRATRNKRKGYYTIRMAELREERGGVCVLGFEGCWINTGLEFAHIKETKLSDIARGRGMPQRYHDIKNNPDAYILVCRHCHSMTDDLPGAWHNHKKELAEEEVPF